MAQEVTKPADALIVIEVTRCSHDYHACIQGRPGVWASGRTPDEAIGDLIRCHAEEFNIHVTGNAIYRMEAER